MGNTSLNRDDINDGSGVGHWTHRMIGALCCKKLLADPDAFPHTSLNTDDGQLITSVGAAKKRSLDVQQQNLMSCDDGANVLQ
eukprot:2037034-Amphidinium_carterae.1